MLRLSARAFVVDVRSVSFAFDAGSPACAAGQAFAPACVAPARRFPPNDVRRAATLR